MASVPRAVWKAREVVLQMLRDRGHVRISLHPFRTYAEVRHLKDYGLLRIEAESGGGRRVRVDFCGPVKLGVKGIRQRAEQAIEAGIDMLVFVYQFVITNPAQREMQKLACEVEAFNVRDLQFNVTRHTLNPAFRAMSHDEKIRVLTSRKWALKDLPRMLVSDPVARYFAFKPGTLVEIRGGTVEGGEAVSYRVVVPV